MQTNYTCISLFCGCGGFDLGMVQQRIECIAAFDINKQAVSVYNNNLPPVAIERDLLQSYNFKKYNSDIIISGAPCQGFSTAGKRELRDPRNKLFHRSVEIALKVKPKVFVAENVAGILSGRHKIEYMEAATSSLQAAGYTTAVEIVDCRNLGMAQMRKRVLLFAWNTKKEILLPIHKEQPKTIRDIIELIPITAKNHDITGCMAVGSQQSIAKHIQQGQKLSNVRKGEYAVHTWHIPDVFGKTTPKEQEVLEAILRVRRQCRVRDWGDADPVSLGNLMNYLGFDPASEVKTLKEKKYIKDKPDNKIDLTNTFNGKFRRLNWDAQSLTVDTRFGSPVLFLHPTEDRAYTVREAARLQGFPDSFIFEGSRKSQYEMVGNAVPPPLGQYAANIVKGLL